MRRAGTIIAATLAIYTMWIQGPAPQRTTAAEQGRTAANGAADTAAAGSGVKDRECDEQEYESWLATQPPPTNVAGERERRAALAERRHRGRTDSAERARRRLTPALIEQVLEVARDLDPQLAKRLRIAKERDPAAFRHKMQSATGRRLIGMAELKANEPKLYNFKLGELQIDGRVNRTARQLREAIAQGSTESAERLREELTELVGIQVVFSFKARGEYYVRLDKHLKALEAEINRAANRFEQTVEERVEHLLGGHEAPTMAAN